MIWFEIAARDGVPEMDRLAAAFGFARYPGETDAALRARIVRNMRPRRFGIDVLRESLYEIPGVRHVQIAVERGRLFIVARTDDVADEQLAGAIEVVIYDTVPASMPWRCDVITGNYGRVIVPR